jgi:hypothetical protein
VRGGSNGGGAVVPAEVWLRAAVSLHSFHTWLNAAAGSTAAGPAAATAGACCILQGAATATAAAADSAPNSGRPSVACLSSLPFWMQPVCLGRCCIRRRLQGPAQLESETLAMRAQVKAPDSHRSPLQCRKFVHRPGHTKETRQRKPTRRLIVTVRASSLKCRRNFSAWHCVIGEYFYCSKMAMNSSKSSRAEAE